MGQYCGLIVVRAWTKARRVGSPSGGLAERAQEYGCTSCAPIGPLVTSLGNLPRSSGTET